MRLHAAATFLAQSLVAVPLVESLDGAGFSLRKPRKPIWNPKHPIVRRRRKDSDAPLLAGGEVSVLEKKSLQMEETGKECDPYPEVEDLEADLGILADCDDEDDEQCVESELSKTGGVCVKTTVQINKMKADARKMQALPYCSTDYCDCSALNTDTNQGRITCSFDEYCTTNSQGTEYCYVNEYTYYYEGYATYDVFKVCYDFTSGPLAGIELCRAVEYDGACEITVNDASCALCTYAECGAGAAQEFGILWSCAGTPFGTSGDECNGDSFLPFRGDQLPPVEPPVAPPTVPIPATDGPTASPTDGSTEVPTTTPTKGPTGSPTAAETDGPTDTPTDGPTGVPTESPTGAPTNVLATPAPTSVATDTPTVPPTGLPSIYPTELPSFVPTDAPLDVSALPSFVPTDAPVTITELPSFVPTDAPVTITDLPSFVPTDAPVTITELPSFVPTDAPVTITDLPSFVPTDAPVTTTELPSFVPTNTPMTAIPDTVAPTSVATSDSTSTPSPTKSPNLIPCVTCILPQLPNEDMEVDEEDLPGASSSGPVPPPVQETVQEGVSPPGQGETSDAASLRFLVTAMTVLVSVTVALWNGSS